MSAYWQHLTVCVVWDMIRFDTVEQLAERLGPTDIRYLRRKVNGEDAASIAELCTWTAALDDISSLPNWDSVAELWPPGSRDG